MPRDIVELEHQIQTLRSERGRLVLSMRTAANELRQGNLALPEELALNITHYEAGWNAMRNSLMLNVDPDASVTWGHCENRVDVLRRAAKAVERLSLLHGLHIADGTDPRLLDPLRKSLRLIEERLTVAPWDEAPLLDAIESGDHPLLQLILFMQTREQLSDTDWTRTVEQMMAEHGPPLTTAIIRGRVSCPVDG